MKDKLSTLASKIVGVLEFAIEILEKTLGILKKSAVNLREGLEKYGK